MWHTLCTIDLCATYEMQTYVAHKSRVQRHMSASHMWLHHIQVYDVAIRNRDADMSASLQMWSCINVQMQRDVGGWGRDP